ncbi:MAG: hypothetical protein IPO94_01550 [Saprospiraceae bacterium]|nr:hypothetical protein [Saprospiraceae bacterium]
MITKVSEPAKGENKPVVNPITDRLPSRTNSASVTPKCQVYVVKEILVETLPQVVVAEEQTARIEIQYIEPEKVIGKPIEVINTSKSWKRNHKPSKLRMNHLLKSASLIYQTNCHYHLLRI